MASQQISVRQDIYNRLKQVKRENESFSDVIERLLED
ncbi:antitoxin VapB family protein [Candidatus Lokiarchaeum ossiferum]